MVVHANIGVGSFSKSIVPFPEYILQLFILSLYFTSQLFIPSFLVVVLSWLAFWIKMEAESQVITFVPQKRTHLLLKIGKRKM